MRSFQKWRRGWGEEGDCLFFNQKVKGWQLFLWAVIQQITSACKQTRLKEVLVVLIPQNLPLPLSKALQMGGLCSCRAHAPRTFQSAVPQETAGSGHTGRAERDLSLLPSSHKATLKSELVEVTGSSTNSTPLSLPRFVWPARGLGYSCPQSPAKQGGQRYLPKSFVLTTAFSMLLRSEAWWRFISLRVTEEQRKLLRAFCNVSSLHGEEDVGRIFLAGTQTQRENPLLGALKGSKYLTINI